MDRVFLKLINFSIHPGKRSFNLKILLVTVNTVNQDVFVKDSAVQTRHLLL